MRQASACKRKRECELRKSQAAHDLGRRSYRPLSKRLAAGRPRRSRHDLLCRWPLTPNSLQWCAEERTVRSTVR